MLNKRVRYGESLEHYYYSKINLLNRCKISGRQAVDCLLHGVDDRAVKVGAQAAQFSEPEKVLKYFRSIRVGNSMDSSDYFRKNRLDKNVNVNKPSFSKFAGNNCIIRCFNCNMIGHPSFKCEKPLIKCTNCDRIGHQLSNCYRNKNKEVSSNTSANINEKQVSKLSVTDKTNDKYVMDVKVNNKTFQCHYDLGSQCSLVRETDAKLLDVSIIKNAELPTLRGIGANLVRPLGLIIAALEVQDIKEVIDIHCYWVIRSPRNRR
ncbi:unnamed protein product [Parnassius mnemosyne]|uniref:CCHC-type domain-containing protein n=1 Tax=Parnassius mnemosyne TaxID=213953 RepID=A0AAV1LR83_9NEOP